MSSVVTFRADGQTVFRGNVCLIAPIETKAVVCRQRG